MSFYWLVAIVVAILVWNRKRIRTGYTFVNHKAAPLKTYMLPVPARYRAILGKYFPYYQKLPPSGKSKFELKLMNFIYGKRFIPRQIDSVTEEAKVLIAASAVQLTFGLPHVYLRHFNKILVYPNNYYSQITKQYHKGEVNPRFGIIVLSWQAFVDGYIDQTDSINVGLHEMAHALRLENMLREKGHRYLDEALLAKFDEYAREICNNGGGDGFFRAYACTNSQEFFSVAIENFFERPEEFQKHLPQLYDILKKLLNQDPQRIAA